MKTLEEFKTYLYSGKNQVSKITIKNYASDISKFIKWAEKYYNYPFNPRKITFETIKLYKIALKDDSISASSIDRYLSSLKNYFKFLTTKKIINSNPFNDQINAKNLSGDSLMLNEFKLFLLSSKLSRITAKNYLMDIKQFIDWLEKVNSNNQGTANIIGNIDSLIIEEYKTRLLKQALLSPLSINRKLSSIRKYLSWIGHKDFYIKPMQTPSKLKTTRHISTIKELSVFNSEASQNNQKINENTPTNNPVDKLNVIDYLIAIPISHLINSAQYLIWKIRGKNIFIPVVDVRRNIDPGLKKILPVFITALLLSKKIKKNNIHNIPKSTYAPLKISINSLPKYKRLLYHIRHARPNWYKIYHSYPISNYLHLGILIICTSILGSTVYNSFFGTYKQQNPVFASPAIPPPKTLMFQGKLTDTQNNPITAVTPLRFAIYNNQYSSGSAMLWQEIQTVTPDQEGKFSAVIGTTKPLSSSIFTDNPNLYLGMTIGNEDELKPRQQLATVGFASNSQKLQGLIPITQSNAGTSNVVLALDSAGNLTIGGKASPIFEASGGQFTLSGKTLVLNSASGTNTNIEIIPDGMGIIDLQKPIQNTSNYNNIQSAAGAVEIDDLMAILATSSGQSALTINQNSTGPIISASSSGTAMFTLENNGTGIFAGNLSVNGDRLSSSNTSFNLLNDNIINLNIAGNATSITIGGTTGGTRINNTLLANGGLTIAPGRSLIVSGNVASSLNPFLTGTYDLGSITNHWKNAYIDNLYTTSTASVSGFWYRNSGYITPFNNNDDLIISPASTGSGKFKIFGSGIYAGSASMSGQLTFTDNSQINLLNNSGIGFYNSTTSDNGINSANPALYITPNGSIGIGTKNPAVKLQVEGDIRSQNLKIASGGSISFDDNSGSGMANIKSLDITGYGSSLIFSTKGNNTSLNEKMRLDGNGSLVLGSPTAHAALDIHGNSGITPIVSISGSTSKAALIVDNLGTGDIFTASSSGTPRFVIAQNGNVGIADTNPANTLKIVGSVCIKNTAGACSGNTSGTIYAANTTLESADVAENYVSPQNLEPGDIVMPEGKNNYQSVIKTITAYQSQAIGIISTKPGITLNSDAAADDTHPFILPLALSGRVPVKVTSENGTIKPGDYITSSSIPGVGMKAAQPGVVIGKALESYSDPDPHLVGKIVVFINVSYYDPSIGHTQKYNPMDNNTDMISLIEWISQTTFSNIQSGFIRAQHMIAGSLDITSDNLTIGGKKLDEYITAIIQKTPANHPQTEILSPLSSGSSLSIFNPNISSTSAVASIDNQGNASFSGTLTSNSLNTNDATISGTLHVRNLIADNFQSASNSATYITNVTNIYNSSNSAFVNATDSASLQHNPASSSSASQSTGLHQTAPSAQPDNESILLLLNKNQQLTMDLPDLSSLSASIPFTPTLKSDLAQFTQGMIVYGPSTLSDVAIAGNLNVGGSLILANNSINTLGSDLQLQPLRQANLSIMGELVTIDTDGNLKVSGNASFAQDVAVKGKLTTNLIAPVPDSDLVIQLNSNQQSSSNDSVTLPAGRQVRNSQFVIRNSSNSGILAVNQFGDIIASGAGTFTRLAANGFNIVRGAQADTSLTETIASSSAGTAVISAYETERTIISPFMNTDSLIYLTATSDTQGLTPYIARQTPDSFTISIPYPINKEVKVNWWIIN